MLRKFHLRRRSLWKSIFNCARCVLRTMYIVYLEPQGVDIKGYGRSWYIYSTDLFFQSDFSLQLQSSSFNMNFTRIFNCGDWFSNILTSCKTILEHGYIDRVDFSSCSKLLNMEEKYPIWITNGVVNIYIYLCVN